MLAIHPTAVVDRHAEISADVEIGPYCVIGPNVSIAEGCRLVAHVHVTGHTSIGAGTDVCPFASLGTPPQSVRYRGGPTRLVIGARCDIREGVTINTGTEDGRGVTEIGDNCFLMVGSHVGHDCRVGAHVTFANNAVLGGHVSVGDWVFLGGQAAVHQFVRIGEGAMIAGVTGVSEDVIPFGFCIGQRGFLNGLNVVGLRRRGCNRADLLRLRGAYRMLFSGAGAFRERLAEADVAYAGDPLVGKILEFIHESGKRSLAMPAGRKGSPATGGDTS
ncbi:MAG: acyl-ACP--UDP-N-acetylglucosamine O-acyltransferase [Rhizobiales bacterium]|nr:acyl-ACP--UDP-N-acetylglucosamine O-acyltransferase [Hyphomicrobiales bacterium]